MSKKRRKKNKTKKISQIQRNASQRYTPVKQPDDGEEVIILARKQEDVEADEDNGDAAEDRQKNEDHSESAVDRGEKSVEESQAEEAEETEHREPEEAGMEVDVAAFVEIEPESGDDEYEIRNYEADDYASDNYETENYNRDDHEAAYHASEDYGPADQIGEDIEEKPESIRHFRFNAKRPRPENITQYFFVIRELTAREIKRKYARSSLGIIWSVLNPLLTMVVMSLIFSTMFRRSIENFPIYLLTGQIFWTLFDTATVSSMSSLVDNKSLLVKAKLPKQTFILSRIYTAFVNFGYTCIAYILMVLIFGIKPGWTMLLFPVDVLFVLVFSTGIGYMLSVAYVFWADIKYFYGIFLRLLMYLSALFYPVSNLAETMQKVVEMNPVYLIIAFARSCVLYGQVPEKYIWIRLIIWCGASIGGGLLVFKKKENDVMQRI